LIFFIWYEWPPLYYSYWWIVVQRHMNSMSGILKTRTNLQKANANVVTVAVGTYLLTVFFYSRATYFIRFKLPDSSWSRTFRIVYNYFICRVHQLSSCWVVFLLTLHDKDYHFFRNACTKSGSLRFSQFSGCWLILSVYILMSFDFPFVRLFGVR
jgi:hypothetical protein